MYLPIGLFGVSIATAATPAISRMVAEQDFARIRSTLANALGLMLFLNVPATVGLMILAEPIVAVIFQHGEFTAADTVATARALQFYTIGLSLSIVRIISPTFYALQRSRIPVMVSAGAVVVNVGLNLTLVRVMGYRGLALGVSITALINATVQLWLLRREIAGLEGRRISSSTARTVAAAAIMGAVTWATHIGLLHTVPGGAFVLQASRLFVTIMVSLATLVAAAQVLSLMMGFAWGMGSLFVPLVGASADRFGIEQTLVVLAFVPLLAAGLAWRLPDRGVHHVEPKVDSLP